MDDISHYKFTGELLLRTPYYSVDDYDTGNLPDILQDMAFRNALLLASPDLYGAMAKQAFAYGALSEKERLTLFKYYNRMSFRPTPFGGFASVSVIPWSAADETRLAPAGSAVLHLLPSIEALVARRKPAIGKTLLFVNPTLYRVGDSWRYTRSVTDPAGKLLFSLHSLPAAPFYDHILRTAGTVPVDRSSLNAAIRRFAGCRAGTAAEYLSFLEHEQVLLSENEPGLIERKDTTHKISLQVGDSVPPAPALPEREGMRRIIPFYTGMVRGISAGGVGPELQQLLRESLQMLYKIVPNSPVRQLEAFKSQFLARFDRQKVPLLTALDPDAGVGYENLHKAPAGGLLEGIQFPEDQRQEDKIAWTAAHRLLLLIWQGNKGRGAYDPVVITDSDLNAVALPATQVPWPPSMAVLFTRSRDGLVIESAGGASGTSLVGRFSVFDEQCSLLARGIAQLETESNPEIVFAEIQQRSHDHVDNINRRIQLYDHLIPLNVFPHQHETGHLLPADLLVSVRGEQLILESVSLGKRVIPRLPTAYNIQHNELAAFRFLADLQYQDLHYNFNFDPERFFPGLQFYPRFVYRDCIVSLAKWFLPQAEVLALLKAPVSLGRFHLFRQEKGIPRWISLTIGDQHLVFDLSNDREVLFFLDSIRPLKSVTLREYLLPDSTLSAGKASRHAGQYIAVLTRNTPVYRGSTPEILPAGSTERRFAPGSEWLYISLYCTGRTADLILSDIISPLLSAPVTGPGSWFFVRYQDPRPHLRIRVRVRPGQAGDILEALSRRLREADHRDLVSDLRTDTYSRELERYSAELIEDVEELFCAGTALCLCRREKPGGQLYPFRFLYAALLRFYGPGDNVLLFLERMKENFMQEFRADKAFRRELDEKYREISAGLDAALNGAGEELSGHYLNLIGGLSEKTADRHAEQRMLLLADMLHMEVNRLFSDRQRQNEALIYYCLHKYERSRIARQQKGNVLTGGG